MSQLTRYGFSREAGRQHLPVPLVRRPVAYHGPWPILAHRTMAEVMAEEERDRVIVWPAPAGSMVGSCAFKSFQKPAGVNPKADNASGLEGSAPEGTSGAQAGAIEQSDPANADQSRTEYHAKAGDEAAGTEHASPCPAVEPVSRPAAGRSAAATSEPMDVTAGETAPVPSAANVDGVPAAIASDGAAVLLPPGSEKLNRSPEPIPAPQPADPLPAAAAAPAPAVVKGGATAGNQSAADEDVLEEFAGALGRVKARRSGEVREIRKAAPSIDFARLAAAARARSSAAKPAPKVPTRHALSADPCRKCGIPGFRGCEHQLPYEEYTPAEAREDPAGRPGIKGRYPGLRGL